MMKVITGMVMGPGQRTTEQRHSWAGWSGTTYERREHCS